MAGIAGIARPGAENEVTEMLNALKHRGKARRTIFNNAGTTLGIVWHENENSVVHKYLTKNSVGDVHGPGHCAIVKPEKGEFLLHRDELGAAPLYSGYDKEGAACFASEVKALLPIADDIKEVPDGHNVYGGTSKKYFDIVPAVKDEVEPEKMAEELARRLDESVASYIRGENMGAWLSGGLDSSAICAIATRHLKKIKTFAAGVRGAPDLKYAREAAGYLHSEHHEVIVTGSEMIKILPKVIYHLESFDALLVRSSIMNFMVAERASNYVAEVFSGEGGDELFAGYEYLKSLPADTLTDELVAITRNLHNTALQRVDRCSTAHGTVAHTPFTNPGLVEYAFSIPPAYKIRNGVEKWILREALKGALPASVLERPKSKFWEGAGVEEMISDFAERIITDDDFRQERELSNGWRLNTKEELYYYRIFSDHFGSDNDLSWMGRTKGSPVN